MNKKKRMLSLCEVTDQKSENGSRAQENLWSGLSVRANRVERRHSRKQKHCLCRFDFLDWFFPWTQKKFQNLKPKCLVNCSKLPLCIQLWYIWEYYLYSTRLSRLWEGSPNMLHRSCNEGLDSPISKTNQKCCQLISFLSDEFIKSCYHAVLMTNQ